MALNFPNDPDNGDTYEGYVWNDIVGAWQSPFTNQMANVASGSIQPNFNAITQNFTFETNYNGVSAGPITIANTYTVTIPSNSNWSIV